MNRLTNVCLVLCLVFGLALPGTPPARAQEDPSAVSYITPFPEGDIYKLQVLGDSLADGALSGLVEALGSDSRLQINRKHRHFPGLTRAEADDEIKAIEDAAGPEQSHITIVMVGRDDRLSIRLPNKRVSVGTDEWREIYGRRADRLMKALKRRGGAVYWIGLPVMQRPDWNDTVQLINDLVRDRAHLNGIKYIDAYAGFADENGSFVALGPDVAGLVRRLREGDGVGFTPAGNRKLAHFVEREIRRDLTQAKNERSIPLAGAEPEQRKINPAKAEPQASGGADAEARRDQVGLVVDHDFGAAADRCRGQYGDRAEGRQQPHSTANSDARWPRGVYDARHPAAGDPGVGHSAYDPQCLA